MKNLQMSLKKQWFEMTKSGIKIEDYREINDYWKSILCYGSFRLEKGMFHNIEINGRWYESNQFNQNTMTLGYPKSTDTERILNLEHKGIEIRTGNPDWGAEPNKLYFVIKHGSEL